MNSPVVGSFTEDGRKVISVVEDIPIYSKRRYTPDEQAAETGAAIAAPAPEPEPVKPKPKAAKKPVQPRSKSKPKVPAKPKATPAPAKAPGPKRAAKSKPVEAKKAPTKKLVQSGSKAAKKKVAKAKADTDSPAARYGLKCLCGCGTEVARKNFFARGHVAGLFRRFGSKPERIAKIAVKYAERKALVSGR